MPAASWKGSVKIGLVQFPVKAVAVDRETKFAFNTHHAADGGRLRANPAGPLCEACGESVPSDQVVKGYGGVAGIDEEYVKSLKAEKSDVVEIERLVPADQIPPRWYRRSYDVIAEKGGAKVYALVAELLEERGRVGVGTLTTAGASHVVAVRAVEGGTLELELLWWPEEMKATDAEARASIEGVSASETEKVLGRKLFEMLEGEFEPEVYVNEYSLAMQEYLSAFLEGKEPVRATTPAEREAPAMSLEDALAQSMAALGGVKKVAKKAKKKEAKVA